MSSEMFLFGDARFLSGGTPEAEVQTYNLDPVRRPMENRLDEDRIRIRHTADSEASVVRRVKSALPDGALSRDKQRYHNSQTRRRQAFLIEDDPLPSVGVELEFVAKDGLEDKMHDRLVSNWFDLEHDGSLPVGGNELVTTPLPASKYLRLSLWTGLHNMLAPWAESETSADTGCHVHVGLDVFDQTPLPLPFDAMSKRTVRRFGALVTTTCYYSLVPLTMLMEVYGRPATYYCKRQVPPPLEALIGTLRDHAVEGGRLADFVAQSFSRDQSSAETALGRLADAAQRRPESENMLFSPDAMSHLVGHSTEVNLGHPMTIEFRRGNGTLDPASLLQMVDFSSLCVRYAQSAIAHPAAPVSTESMMAFIADHATSKSLREIAQRHKHD